MTEQSWRFGSAHVDAELHSLGGMLGPVRFLVGDRRIEPFALAPWANDEGAQYEELPGILRRLRGEWPCVPFGMDEERPLLPPDWRSQPGASAVTDAFPHGFGANHDWRLVAHSQDEVTISIEYPADHAVERLVRTVRAVEHRPALELSLEIAVRRHCEAPIGLHPVYELPSAAGSLELGLGPDARAWTFPLEVEPGRTVLRPDQRDMPPEAVGGADGSRIDIRRLPLPAKGEDLVLVTGLGGRIQLRYPALGYSVTQRWQEDHLPSCLLWISGQGRQHYPWSGRFRGIGVEPVNAPFDLGPLTAATAGNPLARSGTPTRLALDPARPFVTRYEIACAPLD